MFCLFLLFKNTLFHTCTDTRTPLAISLQNPSVAVARHNITDPREICNTSDEKLQKATE